MAKTRLKIKGRREEGTFVLIPHCVLDSPDYINLSCKSKVLLIDLARQYRGKNNGDLSAAMGVLRKRNWKRGATVCAAIKELIDANLILKTREGQFLNPGGRCALYAITWQPIDDCYGKDLEVKATIKAPRSFRKNKVK